MDGENRYMFERRKEAKRTDTWVLCAELLAARCSTDAPAELTRTVNREELERRGLRTDEEFQIAKVAEAHRT